MIFGVIVDKYPKLMNVFHAMALLLVVVQVAVSLDYQRHL